MQKICVIGLLILVNMLPIQAQDLYDIETITTIEITFAESNWDEILDNLVAARNEDRHLAVVVVNGVPV